MTGPKGTVRVLIMDQCPECAPGHLDLSREAFARIADPVQGLVPVTYRAVVNPPLPGPLTFRMKEGASQWWFAVRVGNHGNPLRSVEVRQGDSGPWQSAARQDYNYWLIASGAGPGPFSVRVTDVYGNRVTVGGIRMAPGQVQNSMVRMYGRGAVAATPRAVRIGPTAEQSTRRHADPDPPLRSRWRGRAHRPPTRRPPSRPGPTPGGARADRSVGRRQIEPHQNLVPVVTGRHPQRARQPADLPVPEAAVELVQPQPVAHRDVQRLVAQLPCPAGRPPPSAPTP